MHIAVRSTVVTGAALVGASAIALSPIQSVGSVPLPMSEINVSAAVSDIAVELAALPNPITPWVDVFTAAVTNAGILGAALLADPLPVARQAALNWTGYAQTTATALAGVAQAGFDYLTTAVPEALKNAGQQLRDGNPAEAASILSQLLIDGVINVGFPAFPIVAIPGLITTNLNAAVQAATGLGTLINLLLGFVGPVGGVVRATGDTAQEFVDALGAQDYSAAAQAVFDFGPNLLTAVINGYTTLDGSSYPGLLTPPDSGGQNAGLFYSLLVTLPKTIATAIGAPAPTGAARATKPSAAVVPTPDTQAPWGIAGSGRTTAVGGSKASAKSDTKTPTAAKKSANAKKSAGAKSARPAKGSGHGRGGGAAE